MATRRRTPQWSIALQPDIQKDLEQAIEKESQPKATVLTKAVRLGLKQIISQHQQTPSCSEEIQKLQNMLVDMYVRQGLLSETEAEEWRT